MSNNWVYLEIPNDKHSDFIADFKEACPHDNYIQVSPFLMSTTTMSSPVWFYVPASFLELKPAYKAYGYKLVKM